MTDVEKEESQKTVVSFITGLLIGGLLVWVFSSTPEEKKEPEQKKDTNEQTVKESDTTKTEGTTEVKKDETKKTEQVASIPVGDGSLKVEDQAAGTIVTLGAITLPVKNGWVVVRDDVNGVPGNVLGAARFGADEGLMPTKVELIRKTEAGKTYQVMFYTQEGGAGFALGEDKPISDSAVMFKAQ